MLAPIGYSQGLVVRPAGVVDAAATSVLRRFGQNVGAFAGTSAQVPTSLGLDAGRAALASAVAGADTVLGTLTKLADRLAIADGMSVPSLRPDYNLQGLQAEIDQLVASVDQSVLASSNSGVNLIGSPTANVRIASPNGTVAVTVQPLTSAELGIDSLDLSSPTGVANAATAISAALVTATTRRELLASVATELGNASRFSSVLASSLGSLSLSATGRSLPVGSALDIRA